MPLAQHAPSFHRQVTGSGTEAAVEPDEEVARVIGLHGATGRRLRRALMLVVAAALVVAAVLLWRRWNAPAPVQYETATAKLADLTVTVSATGTVQAVRSVDVGPQISGRVESVYADYNDKVTAGQVLVELDKRQLRARVTEARSRLQAARAALLEARATATEADKLRDRTLRLVQEGIAPKQQVDTAEATAERARAAITSAQAQIAVANAALSGAETDLAWATIRSPIDGIVLARAVEPGQAVAATFQPPVLFVIAEDMKKMELLVDVDEADVGRVRAGQSATFTVDAFPGRTFVASVREVHNLPRDVQGVVTYEAVLTVDNEELLLRPGMTTDVVVTTDTEKNALLVPNAALRFVPPDVTETPEQRREQRVFILDGDKLERLLIHTGASNNKDTAVLNGALKPGVEVVTGIRRKSPET